LTGYSAVANPFVGDAGPTFDPDDTPEVAPGLQPAADELGDGWEAGKVKRIVRAQGVATHELVGVGREDWLWRAAELEALAEPLAAVFNQIPVARAAAGVSDELTVGAVMLEYSLRSIRERSRVLKARKAMADVIQTAPVGPPIAGTRSFSTGYEEPIGAELPVNPLPGHPANGAQSTDGPLEWRVPE
jgi:hypothetical protein